MPASSQLQNVVKIGIMTLSSPASNLPAKKSISQKIYQPKTAKNLQKDKIA
jgi:hypothetical protein